MSFTCECEKLTTSLQEGSLNIHVQSTHYIHFLLVSSFYSEFEENEYFSIWAPILLQVTFEGHGRQPPLEGPEIPTSHGPCQSKVRGSG